MADAPNLATSAAMAATPKPAAIEDAGPIYFRADVVCGCGSSFSSRENLRNADTSLNGLVRAKCMNASCKNKGREIIIEMPVLKAHFANASGK